jgi:hypothetical protein
MELIKWILKEKGEKNYQQVMKHIPDQVRCLPGERGLPQQKHRLKAIIMAWLSSKNTSATIP